MTDYSNFLSQTQMDVDSPVQSIDQLRNDVTSSANQASNFFALNEFQQTVPDGLSTFESMNIEEYLDGILTTGESQALAQIHVENSSMASSTVATMEAATAATMAADAVTFAAAPQFTIAAASPAATNIVEQQRLLRQGSLTLPAHLDQSPVEEVWFGIQQDNNRATNVQRAGFVQQQTTVGEITLEDFLINAGVLSPVSTLQQSAEEYRNMNDGRVELGTPGYMDRPVMSLGEGGDATFFPFPTIPSVYQPPAICYGGRILNNAGGGGGGGGLVELLGSPLGPLSSDGVQVDGVNWFAMQNGRAQNQIESGSVWEVGERTRRRMSKNRASAARSRARKEAYTTELEVEIHRLKEENNDLRQTEATMKNKLKQLEEKPKDKIERLKRNNSWP